MAVFGIPTVHEDDALRAVRAALEMRDAVREMGEIQARIGVNTGDVLARDPTQGESLVVGDAVNVAARLEQAAAPGEVLVGEATWALVGHAAHGERVASIAAKGKREPVAAWRLERRRSRGAGTAPPARPADDRPRRRARPAALGARPGEPGSAAAPRHGGRAAGDRQVAARLGAGAAWATGSPCSPASVVRSPESSSLEPLLEVARAAIPGGSKRLPRGSHSSWAATRMPTRSRRVFAEGAGAPGRRLGGVTPRRGARRDADRGRRARGRALGEQPPPRRRRAASRRQPPASAPGRVHHQARARGPAAGLGDGGEHRLGRAGAPRRHGDTAPAHVREPRPRRASRPGRSSTRPRATRSSPSTWPRSSATRWRPAGLPRSLQVLLAARLEALPEPEREVVGVAAVVGRDFPVAAVEAWSAGRSRTSSTGSPSASSSSRHAPGRHRFGHALLQDAAYGLLPKLRRCELHVGLARWLDERGASDAEAGDHLEHAYRLRTELELVDDETVRLGAEAGTRLAAAGRRADAMGDPRRARFLLERALALLPERSTERAAALVELAAAGWNLLQREELSSLLSEGADLAAELGARAVELRARLLRLGTVPEDAPDYMDERETIVQTNAALAELEAMDAPRAVATALSARGEAEWWLGQAAAAVESVRRAIAVSREADEDSVWAIATLVAAMVDSPMPVSDGEQLLGELMAELGIRPTVRSELIQGQAILALLRGDDAEAWRLFGVAEEIEQDLGRNRTWRLAQNRLEMLLRAGRFDEARPVLASMVEECERRGMLAGATVHAGVAVARRGPARERHGGGHRRPHGPRPGGVRGRVRGDDASPPRTVGGGPRVGRCRRRGRRRASGGRHRRDGRLAHPERRGSAGAGAGASTPRAIAQARTRTLRAALDMHRAKEYALGAAAAEASRRSSRRVPDAPARLSGSGRRPRSRSGAPRGAASTSPASRR